MGVSKRGVTEPIKPVDLFAGAETVPNTFGGSTVRETTRNLGYFNPEDFSYVPGATPYMDQADLKNVNAQRQPYMKQLENAGQQFLANFASSVGQGLANLTDVAAWGNDNYQSKLFGLSTKEMQDWAQGVAARNEIMRANPGKFEPGAFDWLMEQLASSGTGVGMAVTTLGEVAALEFLTGGAGTGAALTRLGRLIKGMGKADDVAKLASKAKDMRSAATLYGVISRANESRMEAMMSYDEIAQEMANEKDADGNAKFTKEQIHKMASAGADRTFWGNIALMPLDILSYRTMVFNPVSGSAKGLLERGLAKIPNTLTRRATSGLLFAGLEGTEEGFQYVMSQEGKHYAKVLGGMADDSTFLGRVGEAVQTDEFWNNFAGGVIGSPIIAGTMKMVNRAISGNRSGIINDIHKDFVENVARMDNVMATQIKQLQEEGKTKEADALRRQFRANKALSALHLDAMTDKDSAFNAHLNFLQTTLEEVNQGKFDALGDLGFINPSEEQVQYVKDNFQDSINDAMDMKTIYDQTVGQYNKNFVPQITMSSFQLKKLIDAKPKVEAELTQAKAGLYQYSELSTQGKTLHDAEYTLRALQEENKRLTDRFRLTKDTWEKDNIQSVIEMNQAKMTEVKEKVNEINGDESYTEDQKKLDANILDSSVLNPVYSQAIAQKEHLDSSIALNRKNLANWNKPEYQAEKTRQSIKSAKTKSQVENTETEISKSGKQISQEEQQAIDDKKKEIDAAEAAKIAAQQQGNGFQQEGEFGNGNLFDDEMEKFLNEVRGANVNASNNPITDEDIYGGIGDAGKTLGQLLPTPYDFANSSDEAKAKVTAGVRGLIDKYGKNITFEQLVRNIAQAKGLPVADEIYNAIKYGWKANNMPDTDFDAVYNNIFNDPFETLIGGSKNLKTAQEKNEHELEQLENKDSKEHTKFDNDNQPHYEYKDNKGKKAFVTNEAQPKLAFKTRLSELIREVDAQGNVTVSHDYTSDELGEGQYVDSMDLLDPDKYNAGTELIIEVPGNFTEILIPIYKADGTKDKAMTFGQYISMKNLTPDMQEYKDKIPMIIYRKGKKADEKGVAFVHDIGWYNTSNFNQGKPEDMQQAIKHTREIRQAVLSDPNKTADITVTGKRQTTFSGLKTAYDKTVTLREANPQTQLTIATSTNALSTSNAKVVFPNNETELTNTTPFTIGDIYDVRRYGLKDGTKTFVALETIRPKLDQETLMTVIKALEIYANRGNPNAEVRRVHGQVRDQVLAAMGLDIFTPQGMEDYLSHFIYVFNKVDKSGKTLNEMVENGARAHLKPGTPFLAFQGGQIIIGRADEAAYIGKDGQPKYSFFINPGTTVPKLEAIQAFAKANMLGWYETNLNMKALNRNKPIVQINKDFTTKRAADSYNDFLLDRLKTNVKSHNIGTPENPNYVTNIQPVITYDLTRNIKKLNEEVTDRKDTRDTGTGESTILGSTEGTQSQEDKSAAEAERQRLLDEAEKDLGNDFMSGQHLGTLLPPPSGLTQDEIWMQDPETMSPEKRTAVLEHIYKEQEEFYRQSDEERKTNPDFDEYGFMYINNRIGDRIEEFREEEEDTNIEYLPTPLSDTQTAAVEKTVNQIAGLTPDQQFDVVDFIYNQIIGAVNFDTKVVSKDEITRLTTKAFNEEIAKKEEIYKEKVTQITKANTDPNSPNYTKLENAKRAYETALAKIQAIKDDFDILQEEAYNRVAKYTGITQNKVQMEIVNDDQPNEENPDNAATDEPNMADRDFWTDVFQESPENKLSYSMRRFFGNVREYDKNGNPMTGFLGLPTYTGSDEIIRKLMVTLANAPANFEQMMIKLKEREKALPWVKEVISKLENADRQKKDQFVTVMSNTSLRMKFMMITFNRRTNTWETKVFDTNLNGVADAVMDQWDANLYDIERDIIDVNADGDYILNVAKARELMHTFENWRGINIKEVPTAMISGYKPTVDQVRGDKTMTISPIGELLKWLNENVAIGDRATFMMKSYPYQIVNKGNNKFEISFLKKDAYTPEAVKNWLYEFGIELTPDTLNELLKDGMYHNYAHRTAIDLFTTEHGLFQILYNKLKTYVSKGGHNFTEDRGELLEDSVIKSLANLEAKYNDSATPFAFRDNSKSIFALTAPKFITDRATELKAKADSAARINLMSTGFAEPSLWLRLMTDDKFRTLFQVSHVGLTAMKERGKKLYRDNSLTKLSDTDHELTKLGMFMDSNQGEVRYVDNDGKTHSTYPSSDIAMRMATMFSPTMSDKQVMTLVTTAVLNLQNKDLANGTGISQQVSNVLYEQLVKPELQRMIQFAQTGRETNVKNYDKGARMFLMLPALNDLEVSPGRKLVDMIYNEPGSFNLQYVESNEAIRKSIDETIRNYVKNLVQEKIEVWKKEGLIKMTQDGDMELKFFDNKYISKFVGNNFEKANMAAADFVINSLIANANSYMVFTGDPAMYYKENKRKDNAGNVRVNTTLEKVQDTFTNMGKRLANQIAPGTTLSNSQNEQYIQLFLDDRESVAENIDYLERLAKLGGWDASAYRKIEASDAQEYTTWKEHLDILTKMGKTADELYDITPEEIQEARNLFSSDVTKANLTEKQKKMIGKVMQPIKPVYTGQMYDENKKIMRTVYIKSSSFPLIPQLTEGMEIDKLRVAMENIQKPTTEGGRGMNVRASYQSANKVGALTTPVKLWDNLGNVNADSLKDISQSILVLDRKNFRIQQEVPFKSGKQQDDVISLGTQLMKLLFGDEIMNFEGFMYNGQPYNGADLQRKYNQLFLDLIEEKKSQLYSELGLNKRGIPIDMEVSMQKLQGILKNEAIKRGYPLQDIQGLTLAKDKHGEWEFNLPLWASANSNRYESMLNAIVTNRIVRMKFPGNSFVTGSEEGFRRTKQEDFTGVDKSKIIFTSAWNGSHLTGTNYENGQMKKAQVLIGSKFKDQNGNLINLFEKVNGVYKYITETDQGLRLKEDMFDKELLSMLTFRIPTSGHQSASQVEIVGFLPEMNGDLMIVPKNFTKQKGLDFDIDKENAYQFWTHFTSEGKVEILSEKHRNILLAEADKAVREVDLYKLQRELENATTPLQRKFVLEKINRAIATNHFINSLFEDGTVYDDEDIKENKFLQKLNSKINEKLLQNELIKINHSVFNNNNLGLQSKIGRVLNTDFSEEQAEFIDELINIDKDQTYWTALSDEYQKSKVFLGASGKIATGAISLDVVFHSLAQQARINGRPISLVQKIGEGKDAKMVSKIWRFGYGSSARTSNSELGGFRTADNGRSISEHVTEAQQIAVDNEKLQIMGRVGLNDETLDVYKVFMLTGLDKGSDGNSIPYLFLSQPIIRDFVEAIKNAKSTMAEFDPDKEGTVVADLIRKYTEGTQEYNTDTDEAYEKLVSDLMTNENLITNIRAEKPDGQFQAAVLKRFIEMKNYGTAIRSIQTTINADSKGLGKSFFDVINRKQGLDNLGIDTEMIVGASNLIGDYETKEGVSEQRLIELQDQGYVDMGKFMVKPNTLTGGFNIEGVATAYNLWKDFFPYDSEQVNKVFNEILAITTSEGTKEATIVDKKQDIFRGIKRYLFAYDRNGIVSGEEHINEERRRLYIDSDTNTSLASYIKALKQLPDNPVVNEFIKNNKLINRFEFDIQKNGKPSLIKYNNAQGEEFDEQYLYESLSVMLTQRTRDRQKIQLPDYNGKPYTLDALAQDMIAYSYLGNGIQEAIQFTKYSPVSYLNQVGFSANMRLANKKFRNDPNILGIKPLTNPDTEKHLVSNFTMQYIQHNPSKVKYRIEGTDLTKRANIIDQNTFTLKGADQPTFVAIYDAGLSKTDKSFRLFWFDGAKYIRIPVLGDFGMDEYQPNTNMGSSIIGTRMKRVVNAQNIIKEEATNTDEAFPFNVKVGTVVSITQSIANSSHPLAPLAKELLPYVGDITIKTADTVVNPSTGEVSKDFDGLYVYTDQYSPTKVNEIVINNNILNDSDRVGNAFMHELVHALTVKQIMPYVLEGLGNNVIVNPDAPAYVVNLVTLFNTLKSIQDPKMLALMEQQLKTGQGVDYRYYGFHNLKEFIAMAMSNKTFQNYLNTIPYRKSGETAWERFKSIIKEIVTSLGINLKENNAAAVALENMFDLIQQTNEKKDVNTKTPPTDNFDPFDGGSLFSDNDFNNEDFNDGFPPDFGDDGKPLGSLLPAQQEREYTINDTGETSHAMIHFFPTNANPNAQVGVFTKFIQLKKTQLIQYKNRLNNVLRDLKKRNLTAAQVNKLTELERELKLQIEGSYELKLTGLQQEIAELEKLADINAVAPYVEKDLKRLERLSMSSDIEDLKEAQRLIDFYNQVGTFTLGIENPFFTQDELFLRDQNGKLTSIPRKSAAVMAQYKEWADRASTFQSMVNKREREVSENQVNNDPSVKKTYKGKQFDFEDLVYNETGLKDVDWISMWTMDITQGIWSRNGLLPQVMFSYLSNSLEKKLAWAREIEEKVDNLRPKVEKELMKMPGGSLRGIGILGIKGASYQIFKEITREGNETGGIIQRFIREFYDAQAQAIDKFYSAFNVALLYQDYTIKEAAINQAFDKLKLWRRRNTIVFDTTKLPEIAGSTPANEAYKQELIKVLGNKGYDEHIGKQKALLLKYDADRQGIVDTLLNMEGVTTEAALSPGAKSKISYWENNHDPKIGVQDYHSVQGLSYGGKRTNNFMDYNVMIPRKFVPNIIIGANGEYDFSDTNTETGYYSKAFAEVESNPTLSEFYDVIKEVTDTVREVMPYELQKKMAANTLPGLEKAAAEMIADKHNGPLSALFLAFKNLIERIRRSFGVTKQSDISYAVIDPATGRPNYKVNDQFLQGNVRAIRERELIEKSKFVHAYNDRKPYNKKISGIARFTTLQLSEMTPAALTLLADYLHINISSSEILAGKIDKIKNITGDTVSIGKYIKDFAAHTVVQTQSFDLSKLAKYFSNIAMAYAGRQEALPILEVMKKHYESIKKPLTNNLGDEVTNAQTNKMMDTGLRTQAIQQMDDWFERVVLNNYGTKHIGPHGLEGGGSKRVQKINARLKDIDRQLQGMTIGPARDKLIAEKERLLIKRAVPYSYGKDIYSAEEKKKIAEIESLLEVETDPDKRAALIRMREGLGKVRTATALFDNLLAWIRTLRLGYNISSAVTNFVEGAISNMIIASTGEHFDPKEIYYGYSVVKYSVVKNASWGWLQAPSAKKNRKLMDKFNVIMDSKNELQKSSVRTYANRLSWMNPHELNQRIEFINQSPIMIAMLRTQKIKGINGEESSIWDAMTPEGHLKPEFKTPANVENWEELKGADYLSFKQSLHKAIVKAHGNYDDLRGMMIKSNVLGKAFMMFKTWLPMQVYQRFAVEQDDIQSGIQGYKGRYRSFGAASGGLYGGLAIAMTLGPIPGVFGVVGGMAMSAIWGTQTGNPIIELAETTKALFKKVLGIPINLLTGKNVINTDKDFEKLVGKGDFTAQDARAMRSNMADLVMQLAWFGMLLMVKAIWWDDDKEAQKAAMKDMSEEEKKAYKKELEKEKRTHNILANKLMQLSSAGAQYVNPVSAFKSVLGSNGTIQYLDDVIKWTQAINDAAHGEDIIGSGINKGESRFWNQTRKTFVPGLFKDPLLGFENEAERQFFKSPYDRYFKSSSKKESESSRRDRAERRRELQQEGLSDKEINKILKEELPTPSQKKKAAKAED